MPENGAKKIGRPRTRAELTPIPDKPVVVRAVVSEWIGLTAQRIDQLIEQGAGGKLGKDRYDLKACVQGYLRFVREDRRQHTMHAADSRVRDARARDLEARTAQRLGHLVPLSAYEDMIDRLAGFTRTELAGVPASCTRDLMLRRIIEREINKRLRRMAEHAIALAIRLETVGSDDAAERADGAGPVGGEQSDVSANGSQAGAT